MLQRKVGIWGIYFVMQVGVFECIELKSIKYQSINLFHEWVEPTD